MQGNLPLTAAFDKAMILAKFFIMEQQHYFLLGERVGGFEKVVGKLD